MDEILVVIICLALNSLLAAYEMAFVSISRSELKVLSKSGDKRAQSLLNLREKPERTLSVIQIGITLVGSIAAAVGGAGAAESIEPILMMKLNLSERGAEIFSLIIVVLPITYLSVVVGELVPKTLALRNPTKIVILGAKTLFILDRVLSPVITVLEWSTQKIINIFFQRSKQAKQTEPVTIDLNEFSPIHKNYMINMADIETKQIREILVPWSQVMYIQSTASMQEVFQVVVNSGHTRLPVKANGSILGVLHTKEFVAYRESAETNWLSIIRPIIRLKPNDTALGAMRILQEKKNHMAIIVSDDDQLIGIVTIEDIIEEVVGDIFDEDDDGRIRKIYAAKIKSRFKIRP